VGSLYILAKCGTTLYQKDRWPLLYIQILPEAWPGIWHVEASTTRSGTVILVDAWFVMYTFGSFAWGVEGVLCAWVLIILINIRSRNM
jgi:hypothetical protein